MTKMKIHLAVLLLCLLLAPAPARAAAAMMISPSGSTEFALLGTQMDDVVGMHIVINYDVSTMSNPSASATGLLLAHSRVTIRMAEGTIDVTATGTEAIGEYGNVVIVQFEPAFQDKPGLISSVSVYLTDSSGRQSSVPVVINNPTPQPAAFERPADPVPPAREPARGADAGTLAGAEGTPRENPGTSGRPATPGTGEAASGADNPVAEPARTGKERSPAAAYRVTVCRSLLDLGGAAGVAKSADSPLPPAQGSDCSYRQEPEALLSDGKSSARLVMELDVKGDTAPNFFIKGAHCLSLKRSARAWELEIEPLPGVVEASVCALYDDRMVEFPLTVAPPLEAYRKKGSSSAGAAEEARVILVNSLVRNLAKVQP